MFVKSLAAAALAIGVVFLSGCSNDKMGMKDSMGMKESMTSANPKDNAIVVTGAHGGTATFVYDSATGKAKMMSSTGDMKECATCTTDANAYYSTGKMEMMCKDCGAKRMVTAYTGKHG